MSSIYCSCFDAICLCLGCGWPHRRPRTKRETRQIGKLPSSLVLSINNRRNTRCLPNQWNVDCLKIRSRMIACPISQWIKIKNRLHLVQLVISSITVLFSWFPYVVYIFGPYLGCFLKVWWFFHFLRGTPVFLIDQTLVAKRLFFQLEIIFPKKKTCERKIVFSIYLYWVKKKHAKGIFFICSRS